MKISRNPFLQAKAVDFVTLMRSSSLELNQINAYNVKYIQHYLNHLEYNLYIICNILEQAGELSQYKRIIDFGGGVGFNTAFIKHLDLDAEIVYLDIDSVSAKDAYSFNSHLNLAADQYLTGSLAEYRDQLDENTLMCSRDVVEHIYDLSEFFRISSKARKNVHNTAAIKAHFFKSKMFKNIHHRAENIGNSSSVIKSRDSTDSYLSLRKEIIQNIRPDMSEGNVLEAALATRGLHKSDIENYLVNNKYPEYHLDTLYTNTCDPNTGNWAERLLSISDYRRYAKDVPLRFSYLKYNLQDKVFIKKCIVAGLNIFAKLPLHQVQASFNIVY